MDTALVNVVYRPLRVGFVLTSDDRASFQKVARMCHTFWGGQYNPIFAVDQPEAADLVELFRPDFLVPVGDDPAIATFVARFPYLRNPLSSEKLFFRDEIHGEGTARILDIHNLMVHWQETAAWRHFLRDGFRIPRWADNDPLADVFLAQFGGFPDPADIGLDYDRIVSRFTSAVDIKITSEGSVPAEILNHPSVTQLNGFGLEPHYTSNANWILPGLYVGDAGDGADLVNFWNLRACGIELLFLDLSLRDRMSELQSAYTERLRAKLSGSNKVRREFSVWTRQDVREQFVKETGEGDFLWCHLGERSWNGLNLRPQLMHFGGETALGIVTGNPTRPRLQFALKEKPFCGDFWFHQQHLVVSISLIGGRSNGSDYTFVPPCIPELNGFAARAMHRGPYGLRLEPDSVGLVINAAKGNVSLDSLSIPALIERIFELAGFSAKPSGSGLITRQLITRMGGVDGARAFKIPGVRKLLKTHGPNASFTRSGALQLIGSRDPDTGSCFADHGDLFIEPRDYRTKLTPSMVFSHLVAKGLFRIGVDLKCPGCELTSWTALDALHQKSVCTLCGNDFDATRQLVEGAYAYRRTGVLGLEKNTQGAVPVVLLLQQLSVNLFDSRNDSILGVSYDLIPKDAEAALPTCETDFCLLTPMHRSDKTAIIIGECKDAGGTIDKNDIDHLRQVADALPQKRFDVFILLAKLGSFQSDEIEFARVLNSELGGRRVIMLTARELEPYNLFERTNAELGLKLKSYTVEDLAEATDEIYFRDPKTA